MTAIKLAMLEQISQGVQSVQAKSGELMEQLSNQATNTVGKGVSDAIAGSFQSWLMTHPTIHWIVDHPLWSVGLIVLAIFLFWGLLRAIAQFMEQVWLLILRSPLLLLRWLLSLGTNAYQRLTGSKTLPAEIVSDNQQRLTDILTRLETLRQEQDELLREVKTLLTLEN